MSGCVVGCRGGVGRAWGVGMLGVLLGVVRGGVGCCGACVGRGGACVGGNKSRYRSLRFIIRIPW